MKKKRTKKSNPESMDFTFDPDGELGEVTVIRYLRTGVPEAEFEHKFVDRPKAYYDSAQRCLVLMGVDAGPRQAPWSVSPRASATGTL